LQHLLLTIITTLFFDAALTLCQVRTTAAACLVPLWTTGRRCSLKYAKRISDTLSVAQQRIVKAQRCHRRRTIRKLHAIDIFLKDTIPCYWSRT